MTLAETIRARRDALGLTRWELTTRLRAVAGKRGVECSAQEHIISYWEGGNYSPGARFLPLLCIALQITANDLLGIKESDYIYGLHSLPVTAAGVAPSTPQRSPKSKRKGDEHANKRG